MAKINYKIHKIKIGGTFHIRQELDKYTRSLLNLRLNDLINAVASDPQTKFTVYKISQKIT